MISANMEQLYPSAKKLVRERVASRIRVKDASLYSFSMDAQVCAASFMGWADLASHPQCDVAAVKAFADEVIAAGFKTVVLIGQGGSTQAPMTITKYNKIDSNRVDFRTLDSDSPVRIREIMASCDPLATLVIVASKSGTTIEPRLALQALRGESAKVMPVEDVSSQTVLR